MPRLTDEVIWDAIRERDEARAYKARALASELRMKGTIHPHDIRQIEFLGDKFMTFMREVLRPPEAAQPAPSNCSPSTLLLGLGAFGFSSAVISVGLLIAALGRLL
jgi:hypothetical protein